MPLGLDREAAPAQDGSVWSISPGRFVIERWDVATGRRLQELKVHAPWFVESQTLQEDERLPPRPLIQRIWEDSLGLLWVVVRVADEKWKPPEMANAHRVVTPDVRNAKYDWLLNVVDPRSGSIIASKRLPVAYETRSPTQFLVSFRESDPIHVTHDVWRPYLRPIENKR